MLVALVGHTVAQQLAGDPVQVGQARHLPAAQDLPDRGGRPAELGGELDRPGVQVQPCLQDLQLDLQRDLARAAMRPARPVRQSGRALHRVAGDPLVDRRAADPELPRDVSDPVTGQVLSDPSYASNAQRVATELEVLPTAAEALAMVRHTRAA